MRILLGESALCGQNLIQKNVNYYFRIKFDYPFAPKILMAYLNIGLLKGQEVLPYEGVCVLQQNLNQSRYQTTIQLATAPPKKASRMIRYTMGTGYTQSLPRVAVCSYLSLLMVACSRSNFSFSSASSLSSSERYFFSWSWLFLVGEVGALMKMSSLSLMAILAMLITGFGQFLTASMSRSATLDGSVYVLMAQYELVGGSTEMYPLTSIYMLLLPVVMSICSLSTLRTQDRSGYLMGEEGAGGCCDYTTFFYSLSTGFTSLSSLLTSFSSFLASFTSRLSSFFSSFSEAALMVMLVLGCSLADVSSLWKELEVWSAGLAESSRIMVITLLKTASLPQEFILESLILISSSVGIAQFSSKRRAVDSAGFSASLITMSFTELGLMKS